LQTKKGDTATGTTSQECHKVLSKIWEKLQELQKKNPRHFPRGTLVVMDNARFHADAIKWLGKYCISIPPFSPECNKPVEHMFHTIKTEFWKRYANLLMEAGSKRFIPFKQAKAMLVKVVEDVVKAPSIEKDVRTLKKTYKAIIDAKGGYISPLVS
jgi:hypothetical protein